MIDIITERRKQITFTTDINAVHLHAIKNNTIGHTAKYSITLYTT